MHSKYCPFITTIVALILLSGLTSRVFAQRRTNLPKKEPASQLNAVAPTGEPIGKRILFVDGLALDVDDAWTQGGSVWYRLKGTSQSVSRPVRSIETRYSEVQPAKPATTVTTAPTKTAAANPTLTTWIYLTDGARLRVDQLREVADGAWYNRNNVSIFLARERISRIEREQPETAGGEWSDQGWSSGNALIDDLIKKNGTRFGVDPFLVFLVIEQESHFRTKAVSPKGARGLMQLMPGTARRFGVKQSFDPGQNIRGGTQYLRELLDLFKGRVDLALASYNAGEGRVIQYGNRVPPFRETQNYVQRIGKRYGKDRKTANKPGSKPTQVAEQR